MLITSSLLVDLFAILVTLAIGAVTYLKWSFTYWKRKGFPALEASFPFGTLENPAKAKETIGVQIKNLYDKIRAKNLKYCGMYVATTHQLLVTDLDLLKNIMGKDFQYFTDRGLYYNEEDEPMGAHLFSIGGPKWRHLRTKLTPTFTSGKIKNMFQTLVNCIDPMLKAIDKLDGQPLDIKDIAGRFTTDIIGSVAFGLEFNTFDDPNSPFRKYGIEAFTMDKKRKVKMQFANNFPNLARRLHVVKYGKELTGFFTKIVTDTVDHRKRTGTTRKDFLQLMMDMVGSSDNDFTINEIVAQSYVFFLAGFETSSTTMTFALFEIAKNPEIQNKLREEIERVLAKHDGQITYEAINEMKYLDQVVEESLRRYPPAPLLGRECVKDYNIPETDLVIEKGVKIIIPIYGIHMDPEYYPEPDKFDPERFSDENKKDRHQYAHIPFGEGPRICIGLRFGMMQAKVGLAAFLKNYQLTVNPKTKQPVKMDVASTVLSVDGGVWLNAKKITK